MENWDARGAAALLVAASEAVTAAQDLLTKADQAIGDGDHGIGMSRGCEAVRNKLSAEPPATPGAAFSAAGIAMMMSVGGSSGAIFGTLFSAMGKRLGDAPLLTASLWADAIADGMAAVQKRGGAKVGDKTLIDALAPAVEAAREHAGEDFDRALALTAEAAVAGAEKTKALVATLGRAKTLGERCIGHVDPGALSLSIWLTGMAKAAASSPSNAT